MAVTDGSSAGLGSQPISLPYVPSDPEAFARNLAKALEEGGRALSTALAAGHDGDRAKTMASLLIEVTRTLSKVGEYWTSDPMRLMEAQSRLLTALFGAWGAALAGAAGQAGAGAGGVADKRFGHSDWNANPVFASLKAVYLAVGDWAIDLVERAEDVDKETRDKARFYIQQIANAASPSNFLLTNPEVLKETASSNAENLVRGMQMLAEDLAAGKGSLRIRQSDATKFKVGENLAVTPGKVIYQNDICQIIQYESVGDSIFKRPLLIVPPWINKFYVLDLTPEKSLIGWLVEQGHTVFVISWINPEERHAKKSFEHYMKEGILTALDVIETATGEKKVNAVGYCVGGTLLAVTLGYMAAKKDRRIASATLLTTQIDFSGAGDLKIFAGAETIEAIEDQMKDIGYLEGSSMATAFNLLRSNDLIWPYVVNNYLRGKAPGAFDLLYWNADATRMPAANHAFYLRSCYLENRLASGEMKVGGVRIDLSKVKAPIYNLATRDDHIAPAASVFLGSRSFGGDVRFVLTGSGHIAGVVNPPARQKYQYWTGGRPKGRLDTWIGKATEHKGSWWPDWQAWIVAQDGRRTKKKRVPGGGKLDPIEDAPGSYVKVRS